MLLQEFLKPNSILMDKSENIIKSLFFNILKIPKLDESKSLFSSNQNGLLSLNIEKY
jgi:hypothetical protein